MTDTGGRRRWWRWIVVGWAVTVAVGGGLTLWLQDSAEPPGPYVWENYDPSEAPAPLLQLDATELPCPAETAAREGEQILCAYATIR
ncbi:hypothetical protein ACGFNV_07790 [Streptomyces sp. NPDC048751]|uniref:hypothetical protein n=1 Tax=Streptomyces sp. NPDC048751 TaxID=3365591 RepID=UPI00371367B1